MVCSFLITITSVFEWSVKAYHTLCFPLKVGRSAMAYFGFLRSEYNTEVIYIYVTELVTEPILLYFFFY